MTSHDQIKSLDDIPGPQPVHLFEKECLYLPNIGDYPLNHLDRAYADMHKKFGPLVRECVDEERTLVHVFDLNDMQTVCSNEGSMPERPSHSALGRFREEKSNIYPSKGLVPSNGEEWLKLRKLFAPVLETPVSETALRGLEEVVDDLMKNIAGDLDAQKEIDVSPLLYKWALESIGVILLNLRLGCFTDGHEETVKLIKAVKAVHEAVFWTENDSVSDGKYYKEFKKAAMYLEETVKGFMEKTLDQIEKTNEKDSVLAKMLEKCPSDKATILTMLIDLFLGGIDTTANAATFVLYNLAINPSEQEKFRAELMGQLSAMDTGVAESRYSHSSLLAVLEESLRVNPISVGIGRVLPKDLVLSGYVVPAKTMVILQHQVASMQEKYVKDPKIFQPERWVGDERPSPLLSNQFGTGPRMCIGHRIAKVELQVLIAKIFQRYKITYHHEPIVTYNRLVNVPLGPVRLRFHSTEN